MKVDPLCAAIRLAPIGLLFAVHCSNGHWPSDAECADRVTRYGFCVQLFRHRPLTVLTHLFVHISSQHLIGNAFSFAATIVEFGDAACHECDDEDHESNGEDEDEEQRALGSGRRYPARDHLSTTPTLSHMAIRMRAHWEEQNVLLACVRTCGVFLVWACGGVVGGLGGQLIYNDSKLAMREVRAMRDQDAVSSHHVHSATEGASVSLPSHFSSSAAPLDTAASLTERLWSRVESHATSIQRRLRAVQSTAAASAQAAVNESMFMCGASAGICAVSGFNMVYYGRGISAMCMCLPEIIALARDLLHSYTALLGPVVVGKAGGEGNGSGCVASSFISGSEAEQRAMRSAWRTLLPGQAVGHAAHVGGFLAGAYIGYLWRRVDTARRQGRQRRLQREGQPAN